MFLLDTNIASELRKMKPHGAVLQWYKSHRPQDHAIPSIAVYEIQAGAEITRRQDPAKAREIERWVEALISETRILSFDARAAREAAAMMRGTSRDLFEDAMIAAIAKVNGLTVATRNTRDFEHFDVALVNPFLFPG